MNKTPGKKPDGDAAGNAQTFTSPPMVGSVDVWARVEAEVDDVPEAEAVAPRVDLQAAGETALAVCADVRDDAALYARFKAVATLGEVDGAAFSKLQRYAGAAWYAQHRKLQAKAGESFVTVPEELVARGTELFGRMHRLAVYHFGDHPEEGAAIITMNASPGHRKLANHLVALADVYARHGDVVAKDPRHYRSDDERMARKVAADIVKAMSEAGTPEADLWTARCAKVWTLLSRTYAEVQSTGRWLLRATPEAAAERFPSLVAESRGAPQPRKTVAAPVDGAPADGAAPATPAASAPKRKRRRTR